MKFFANILHVYKQNKAAKKEELDKQMAATALDKKIFNAMYDASKKSLSDKFVHAESIGLIEILNEIIKTGSCLNHQYRLLEKIYGDRYQIWSAWAEMELDIWSKKEIELKNKYISSKNIDDELKAKYYTSKET